MFTVHSMPKLKKKCYHSIFVHINIKWELKLLSSGLWHYVVLQADTDILKEHALSIFRVQELAQLHIELEAW
jgi:hypothetical protein